MHKPYSKFEKLARFLMVHAWAVVIIVGTLTAISAPRGVKLLSSINTSLSALLPDEYPSVKVSREIKEKFSKKQRGNNLVMVIDSPSREANEKVVKAIADYLAKIPSIDEVNYLNIGYDFFKDRKLMFLDLDDLESIRDRVKRRIQQEKLGGLFIDLGEGKPAEGAKGDPMNFEDIIEKHSGYLNSANSPFFSNADGTVIYMKIYPDPSKTSLKYYNEFFTEIQKSMGAFPLAQFGNNINISYAGSIITKINEYNSLISDLTKAGLISTIGIFIILIIYFRRIVAVFVIFIPLASGILQGFAFCSFFVNDLNVVTSFLFSILFGLGVDVGIHMMDRYLDDRHHGILREEALVNVFTKTGKASTTSVLTTCATLFILVVNDFKGFSEFGFIAGLGLFVVLLNYLFFFPALLLLFEKFGLLNIKKGHKASSHRLVQKYKTFPAYKTVLASGAVLLVVSLIMLPRIGFEWNYGSLKFKDEKTLVARDKMRDVSGRVNSPAGIVIHSREEADLLKAEFKKIKNKSEDSLIETFRSGYDLNPEHQDEKMVLLKEIDTLLADDALNVITGKKREALNTFRQTIAETKKVFPQDVPPALLDGYQSGIDGDTSELSFVFPKAKLELDDGRNAIKFFDEVHEVKAGSKTFHATSDSLVFANVLITMFSATKEAMAMSITALLILLYIDFRNVARALTVFAMVAFGIVSMVASAALFGLKFNFFNMISLPTVLGMGEDNCVHVYSRFEENGKKSVMQSLSTSGVTGFLASITTIMGYAGLMFAHHPGLKSIGQFAVIGMTACMFTSLVIYPALLEYLNSKGRA